MTTTVCELYLNFLKQVKEKQFSRTIKGKHRGMSRLISPSVSESPLARVKRDPRFCRVLSTSLTEAPLVALASVEPSSARPTCLFTTQISKASTPSLPLSSLYLPSFIHPPSKLGFVFISPVREQCLPNNRCSINFW